MAGPGAFCNEVNSVRDGRKQEGCLKFVGKHEKRVFEVFKKRLSGRNKQLWLTVKTALSA